MSPRVPVLLCLFAFAVVTFWASGCAPRRIAASSQSFYGSGLADFSIDVAPPLTLATSGRLTAQAPSDDNILPANATLAFSVFTDSESGPVDRHAHILFSELPRYSWRWEMETWARHDSLLYTGMRAGGKNWTIQIFPVTADADWFSSLWRKNGRQVPDFWLAKRWSSTPEDEMRLLAEYREPAPACMRERLAEAAAADRNAPPLEGKDLRRGCDREIEEFSSRADGVFNMEKLQSAPAAPVARTLALPEERMNMRKLVGKAEIVDRFSRGNN